VALTRARLGIQLIASVIKSDTFIFQFWYPKFSYICWFCIHIFVYYFQSNYLLTYLLVGLIWLTLTHSEWWCEQVTPFLETTLFSTSHMHPLLQRGRAINTLSADDIANIRNINGLL
jgi:hypothetical protein